MEMLGTSLIGELVLLNITVVLSGLSADQNQLIAILYENCWQTTMNLANHGSQVLFKEPAYFM